MKYMRIIGLAFAVPILLAVILSLFGQIKDFPDDTCLIIAILGLILYSINRNCSNE